MRAGLNKSPEIVHRNVQFSYGLENASGKCLGLWSDSPKDLCAHYSPGYKAFQMQITLGRLVMPFTQTVPRGWWHLTPACRKLYQLEASLWGTFQMTSGVSMGPQGTQTCVSADATWRLLCSLFSENVLTLTLLWLNFPGFSPAL